MTSILVVTNMYPPHHLGGYELTCQDTVAHWRRAGHDVQVLTSATRLPDVEDIAGERDLGVWRDLAMYWDDHVLLSPRLHRRLAIERANQRALGRALQRAQPDVVSIWAMGALSLGLLTTVARRGLPMVFCLGDEWLLYGGDLDAWSRLFRGRPRLAAGVQAITGVPTAVPDLGGAGPFCFVSERIRERAQRLGPWQLRDTAVVPPGIDGSTFPIADSVREHTWRWRLLYVGRLDERKGIDTAVRALPLLPDETTLAVVGKGDAGERDRIDALVAELGVADRVRFTAADRSDLPSFYEEADVFVFPSTWEEPFGLTPLEAMACGTPVVATAAGGSREYLVDGDNCLLFEPGDPRTLAAAVDRLASDPDLRRRLASGGLRTAAQYSMSRMASTLDAWHTYAASGDRSARPPTS